jgi:hypothetical protein
MAILRNDKDQVFRDGQVVSETIVVRDVTQEVNEETVRDRARQAFTGNQAFLSLPAYPATPTTAQRDQAIRALLQQTESLTRQTNALIRLQLQDLDDVSDT